MFKGLGLWGIWILSSIIGIYGMSLLYNGISGANILQLVLGLFVLLLGFWGSGNILAAAKTFWRTQKTDGNQR